MAENMGTVTVKFSDEAYALLCGECRRLEAALREIAYHKFTSYEARHGMPRMYDGQYGTGVVDGHRAAAAIARKALAEEENINDRIMELVATMGSEEKTMMQCTQHGCKEPAVVAFTWPGQDQAHACLEHAQKLKRVAEAMGCHVQLLPLAVPVSPWPEENNDHATT